MNQIKEINIKNHIYYFFGDMINIKNFDPNQIKIDKKWYQNIIIYYIGYITIRNLSYIKNYSVNPLYLIIDRVDGCIEENNGNKYLRIVSNDKNKDTLKKYAELWDKTKDLIRSVTNNSGDYDEKYMKMKFNSDDNLPWNKILKLHNLTIVVTSVFQKDKEYYPQDFLYEYLYEL